VRAFITGTDTGVGKTYCTALLAHGLRDAGLDTVALKPVCCGGREDAEILRAACGNELTLDEVNPLWYPAPVAPLVAAGDAPPSLEALVRWFKGIASSRRSVLVEGVGGWLVPLAPGVTMADLAVALGLPVLVVVANRLGCLNHALLTVESIRAHGLPCLGFVLNSFDAASDDESLPTNRKALEEASGLRVVVELLHGQKSLEVGLA